MLLQLYAKIGSPLILLSDDSIDEELSMGVCIKISQIMWQIQILELFHSRWQFLHWKIIFITFSCSDEDHKVCRKA